MIIRRLVLHNFGVYASTNVFEFHGEKPVVLIGGMNGRGKTTFLEAVLLSLYGSNSFAYRESKYKTFGQYLKSFVNVSDGSLDAYVDLEFAMESEVYYIHREWSGAKQRVAEIIKVYKDGEYSQFLTDNWSMFIENILPSGLSNFFFFDGEKIAELAVEETSAQMKDSIKTLLGISVIDLLKSDLNRIINRNTKKQFSDSEVEVIERLREKRDMAIEKLNSVDAEVTKLQELRTELLQELELKRQEYSTKGGDIVTKRQELFNKRAAVSAHIETVKEQLLTDAASELPLVLVVDLLKNVRENAEVEQNDKMLFAALSKMKEMLPEYLRVNKADEEATRRFISFINGKTNKVADSAKYRLSDNSLLKLQVLLDKQLDATKSDVAERQRRLKKLQEQADQLDNYMSVEIDEKSIAKTYRKIKELENKIIDVDVKLNQKVNERRTCNGEVIGAVSVFNKHVETYLERAESNDEGDRLIKYSHIARSILEEYKIRLQRDKIGVVAETMTSCYKKLANKKNLIDRIEMDPVTLDIRYVNSNGENVNKASLSAGEKQLMVISLLWALALCSKKKLPVIIDTPLSRLDSAHRVSLIRTYFPQASEQTIILSTDSEIDRNYYEIMKNDVGDEFTLIYDDASKSTSIRRGYFMEDLK